MNKEDIRILVVDDEESIRCVFSDMISLMGFEVAVSGSGDDALGQFLKSSFDLVLTDLNMPGIDGWTLARHMKEISPGTRVVLVTGEEREMTLKKMEDSSVDFALFKPVGLHDVQDTVQRVLSSH